MKYLLMISLFATVAVKGFTQAPLPPKEPRTISVEGAAEMEIVPDEIYASVTLKEYEKRSTGKVDIETIKTNFLQLCKNIGIADSMISVDSYAGFSDNGWWRRGKRRDELNNFIEYQIKFSSVELIEKLLPKLDDDATENFRIVRTSHSKIREYRKQLKITAVKAAKEKAAYLAEAIDEKIGAALSIVEPEEDNDQPYLYENRRLAQSNISTFNGGDPSGSIEFKKFKLRYAAKVVFALK